MTSYHTPARNLTPLSEAQMRHSLYLAVLLALLLPPFVGGTLMGLVGYYPLPEFYLIFTSYSGLYLILVAALALWLLPRLAGRVITLTSTSHDSARRDAMGMLPRLPWYFLAAISLYSLFGVLSADISLQSMGYHHYTLRDHFFQLFGTISVVLLTSFPILFFLVDRLGRYLAPQGFSIPVVPLPLKIALLGLVSPLLIDSLLIGYYYNRTGYFESETLLLWLALIVLAAGGTLLAWRSLQQSISPLQAFIESGRDKPSVFNRPLPTALSLDELGVLSARFAELLSAQNRLNQQLLKAETLADTVIKYAGALVVVLDREGHIVRFNRACERLSGFSATEVVGRYPWETVLPAEDAERVRQHAFVGHVPDPMQLASHYVNYWQSKDGSRHLIEWRNTQLLDQSQQQQHMICVGIDITERREAEELLQRSRAQLNEAQRLARVGSWSLDLQHNRLEWSDEIFRLFELDRENFSPSYEAFLEAVHPADRDAINLAYTESLQNRKPYQIIHRLLFPDGRIKYVRESGETEYNGTGEPLISRGTVQDITEQHLAQESINLYASVFQHSAEAIMITDHENRIVAINPAMTELTGYTQEELLGRNPSQLASGITPPQTYEKMWHALQHHGHWQGELVDRRKSGEIYPKWATISAVYDSNGEVINYISSFSDITERKASEERIFHLAHHDTLTGLANRFSLEERLEREVTQARRTETKLAVMFIDMDRFKVINDTLGHHVGDGLLVEVAKRLRAAVRESDIVARLGGDEFVVVLTNIEERALINSVAQKIMRSLTAPYKIFGHELRSSPSVGIALFPNDGEQPSALMKGADAAMYHAKAQGRNNFQFFASELSEAVSEGMALERDLRLALEREEFTLHYQPKVRADSGQIIGVEALLRWHHPQRGLVSPEIFIPIAEQIDLISPLGNWVVDEACRQLAQWRAAGLELSMAINLSPLQLRDPKLVETLRQTMKKYQLSQDELELEITETAAMTNAEHAIKLMQMIRTHGITLAIDDFGTGYSSLAYLKSFPIQTLKLDRSFVSDIGSDDNGTAICKATISLAHSLGLQVVAEGVETELQKEFLMQHHCNIMQGYLYSPPLPAAAMTEFLHTGYRHTA